MHYGLRQTVAPATEPVTVDEAKAWCKVEDTTDDLIFPVLIAAARERGEAYTGRQFVTATWALSLDWFPGFDCRGTDEYFGSRGWDESRSIRPPKAPLIAVSGIAYTDTAGAAQTLSPTLYTVDVASDPGRIVPAYSQIWPNTRAQQGAVVVTYTAGYGVAAAVPAGIKLALRFWIANRYYGRSEAELSEAFEAMLTPYWTGNYGGDL